MKRYSILLVFYIFSNQLYAQQSLLQDTDSLDRYIAKYLNAYQIPGLSIGIIKDGTVYYQKAYNTPIVKNQKSIDIHTLFPIASITKTFTGALLSVLAYENKCSLNAPVSQYVSSFKNPFKSFHSEISLADILSHRSGWKTFQGDFLNTESTLTDSQLIYRLNYLKPAYPLRTKFGYSNMGFLLAGVAIQNITRSSYAEQLNLRFFNPLQMHQTFVDSNAIKKFPNKALLYAQINDEVIETSTKFESPRGYGGMYSNVHDLTKYMLMLLDSGRYHNKQIIPFKAIEQINNSFTIIGKQTAGNRKRYLKTYGLGWEIIQYEGVEIVQHGGAYAGSLSMLALVPSQKFGLIILTNADYHPLHETLKWQLIDALLNFPSSDYSQDAFMRRKQRLEKSFKEISIKNTFDTVLTEPHIMSKSIEAVYHCDVYGKAEIKKLNNKYMLYLEHHPSIVGELQYKGDNIYECSYSHAMFGKQKVLFHLNEKGINGFDLSIDPFIEDAVYSFYRL